MQNLIILIGGILIGTMGVTLGGSMFIAIPFWQYLFPGFNYGQIIGNIKVGSITRGLASTISTWKKIAFKDIWIFVIPFILGAIIGSMSIAKLDQKYLFFAVIAAIFLSEISPKIAHLITKKTRFIFSIILGIYIGFIGAGVSILLVALMRTMFTKKEDIIFTKIQARFIESTGAVAAIGTHIYYGNITFPYWIYWTIGTFIGGYIGGTILKKTTKISPKLQHKYLIIVYIVALIPFLLKFINL